MNQAYGSITHDQSNLTLALKISTKGMQSIYYLPTKPLQSRNWLDLWTMMWEYTWLHLQTQIYWHIYARIDQITNPKYEHVWSRPQKNFHTPYPAPKKNFRKPVQDPSQKTLQRNFPRTRKICPTSCGKHSIPCQICQHHPVYGTHY